MSPPEPGRRDRPGGPVRMIALVLGALALLLVAWFLVVDITQALAP